MPSLGAQVKDKLAIGVNVVHRGLVQVSGGRIGTRVMGMPTVRLVTTGRKSGTRREVMLTAPVVEGDRVVLVASYGGDDRHPAWFLNLQADPNVELSVAGAPFAPHVARVADEAERAELWPRVVEAYKGYDGYQRRTDRQIPLVLLDPA